MFQQLKRKHDEDGSEESELPTVKKLKSEEVTEEPPKRMMFFKSWTDNCFEPTFEQDYRGDDTIVLKDGSYNAMVTTAH